MNFLTRKTKTTCIIASVLTALALITLVMLSSLLTLTTASRTVMCLIYSVCLMLVLLMWEGTLQIKVFNDYKSQKKLLCADGIIDLCMGALIIICSILFGVLQASKIVSGIVIQTTDIRIFLTCFLGIMFIWKLVLVFISGKEKRFNWWIELILAMLWLVLTILTCASMFTSDLINNSWLIVSISWILITVNIFYMLFSYVIKEPKYLETEKAISILEEEQLDAKFIKLGKPTGTNRLQEKLRKLKDLKDNGLITDEDYESKKKQLLENL